MEGVGNHSVNLTIVRKTRGEGMEEGGEEEEEGEQGRGGVKGNEELGMLT